LEGDIFTESTGRGEGISMSEGKTQAASTKRKPLLQKTSVIHSFLRDIALQNHHVERIIPRKNSRGRGRSELKTTTYGVYRE